MAARTLACSIALVATLLSTCAQAVTKTWIGTDGGSFGTSTNWDPAGAPGSADSALFVNGAVASTYDISFDANATLTQLTVATSPLFFAGPSRTLSLTSTSSSTTSLLIGRTGSGTASATLTSNLAQLNAVYAMLGANTGSSGTLNLVAGALSVSGTGTFTDFAIGNWGSGTVNVSNGADVTVTGETWLAVYGGSVGNLSVTGTGSTWTNTGILRTGKGSGTINVGTGATLSATGGIELFYGRLTGNGDINAAVNSRGGIIAPSSLTSGYGTLHITGPFTPDTNSKIEIQIRGTTAGTFDRLNITGAATLAGTLQVTLPSFAPSLPQNTVLDILDFTSVTGTFATVTLPGLTGSLEWDTSKLYTDGTIRVVLPGDFNNNGTVDAADYALWQKGLGTIYTAADYNTWRTHYGKTAAGSGTSLDATTTIPEPASLTLALLAIAALTHRRRL